MNSMYYFDQTRYNNNYGIGKLNNVRDVYKFDKILYAIIY